MSDAHAWLRSATATAHARVDAAFSGFVLHEPASYRRFLLAHARALLPIEVWLENSAAAASAGWTMRPRRAALEQDLTALDATAPQGAAFDASDDPASLAGILYVLEGSRIGGNVLAKRVGPGLPRAYLSSPCDAQSWRRLLARLDAHIHDDETRVAAANAALQVFERFERSSDPAMRVPRSEPLS